MSRVKADAVVAVAMTSGVVLGCLVVSRSGEQRPLDSAGFALLVVTGAALTWRRSRPVPAAVVAGAACVAYYALLYPGIFAAAPVLLAVYTVVSRGVRWAGVLIAVGFVLAFYLAIAVARGDYAVHDGVLWQAGFLVTVVAIGQTVATHRAYLREVELRVAEGERTREEAALRRAGEERLWIAQELHDTLTHTISVMNVQAGVAAHLIDHDPGQVRIALAAIKEAGQEAMRELRGTLGVLRQADTDAGVPGMEQFPRLVARAEGAGLRVAHEVVGRPRPLPDDADRAAYRIAQEALTNVLRHAGTADVTVCCSYDRDAFRLRVHNDGAAGPPSPGGTGMGLIGMRERAMAAGGRLTAGPLTGGGFLVEVELPLSGPA